MQLRLLQNGAANAAQASAKLAGYGSPGFKTINYTQCSEVKFVKNL
jgi:hypothetical protein